jgi:phosphoglycolate phosphatase-like HAD superfamily hydrolase
LGRVQAALAAEVYTVIISTKEGRFIAAMLQQAGVSFPRDRIYGKEVQQPKTDTLRQVIAQFTAEQGTSPSVWFIEDRYKTLVKVKAQADLAAVQLFLGDWGYNTAREREAARHDDRIHLLSLAQLVQGFDAWTQP